MFRELTQKLKNQQYVSFEPNKTPIQILYGARRVGKSTLLKNTFPNSRYVNVEDSEYNKVLESKNVEKIKQLIGSLVYSDNTLILDEFQKLSDPAGIAKLIYDSIDNIKLILSGSSSLEISNKSSDSLAGRSITNILYPLSVYEYLVQKKSIESYEQRTEKDILSPKNIVNYSNIDELFELMRVGLYPLQLNGFNPEEYLENIVDSYLLKDLLYLEIIRNTKVISDLLTLLAYQIGSIIKYSEISSTLGIDTKTVQKYIGILEDLFIIYRLRAYRNTRRDEIAKSEKIYFYDLGIRNAIINNFNGVKNRNDVGNIFENFVLNEFKKINSYNGTRYTFRFWRTQQGSEIDLLVLNGGKVVKGYEIKVNKGSISQGFKNTYPEIPSEIINLQNLNNYLL